MPKVSVVIPCYNQGAYVEESVESVLSQTWDDYEIIIVNDGSTDEKTLSLLDSFDRPKTTVFSTENAGLAAARNHGINLARGEYILPLDADDKIGSEYLEEAVKILDRNPDIGIVYCEAQYFGEKDGMWHLPEFSKDLILGHNIIFASAFFRKKDWERVGGYNINMVYGWEDWDFWLSLLEADCKIYRIPRILFYYRVKKKSMIGGMKEDHAFFMRLHACLNHKTLYRNIAEINILLKIARLYVDTGFGFGEFQTLSQVVTGSEKRIEFDLSGYGNIKVLRFDPVNDFAILKINSINCFGEKSKPFKIETFDTNASAEEANIYIFAHKDPQVRMKLPQEPVKKLVIDLEYLVIGKESLEEIARVQNDHIEDQRNRINLQRSEINEKDDHINALRGRIEDQDNAITGQNEVIAKKDKNITDMMAQIDKLQDTIDRMQNSRTFRTANFVRKHMIDKPLTIFKGRGKK